MKNQQRTCRIPAHLVWLAAVALLTAACASIGNPSGGARDEQPPRFVRANPAPYATDVPVTIEKINIDFDELINVKDAFSKVVVSPPSKSVPRVASQGHRVTVTFSDTLLENTTYTINFADAIEDNNEANPLENFSYTFSTGPYVDSLRIAGRVLSAQAMEPMQGKIVGVHRLADAPADSLASAIAADSIAAREQAVVDSIVFRRQFDRVARTDDRGRFSIEGLAPGRYRVFALDDANTDYIYSSPDEEFAFYEEVVEPYALPAVATDTIYNLKLGTIDSITTRQRSIFYPNDLLLRSFLTSRKQQYITNYQRQDSTRLNLTFNAPNSPLPEISLVGATDLKDWYIMERSAKGDSLTLWLKSRGLVSNDTLRMAISYLKPDSLNRYVATNDTLRFTTDRPRKPKADNKKKKDAQADTLPPPPPLLSVTFPAGSNQEPTRPLLFMTETPLARLDTLAFRLEVKRDTIWTPLPERPRIVQDSLNPRLYSIVYPWQYDTGYRLQADSLAMEGIYGLFTGPVNQEFKVKAEKEFCSLTLNVADWPAGVPAFVEIVSTSDTPTERVRLEGGRAVFRNLVPGKFYFRIIADYNGNGEWDSGDIVERRQPEPAFYYPKSISIKQNWNKEETWRVFDTPADAMKPETLLKNKPTQRKNAPTRKNQNGYGDEEDEDDDYYNGYNGYNGYNSSSTGNYNSGAASRLR